MYIYLYLLYSYSLIASLANMAMFKNLAIKSCLILILQYTELRTEKNTSMSTAACLWQCASLECACTSGFVKSANEYRQSVPLTLCDLSEPTEALTAPFSRTLLCCGESVRQTLMQQGSRQCDDMSDYSFFNRWEAYMKQSSARDSSEPQ